MTLGVGCCAFVGLGPQSFDSIMRVQGGILLVLLLAVVAVNGVEFERVPLTLPSAVDVELVDPSDMAGGMSKMYGLSRIRGGQYYDDLSFAQSNSTRPGV